MKFWQTERYRKARDRWDARLNRFLDFMLGRRID